MRGLLLASYEPSFASSRSRSRSSFLHNKARSNQDLAAQRKGELTFAASDEIDGEGSYLP